MNDVFISYEHQSKSIADNICSVLERNKIRCWYAPRDVIGDYATSIVEAIGRAKVFVLILNGSASKSRHVLNEVEIAYKIENDITIVPFKVSNDTLSMAMEYYVKRLHWIDAADRSLDSAIDDLLKKVAVILGIDLSVSASDTQVKTDADVRTGNKYFTNDDDAERNRLKTQLMLMEPWEAPIYDRVLNGRSDLRVLDIGCNDGEYTMSRLGIRPEVSRIVGLEYDADAVDLANRAYGSDSIRFYQCDIESPDFGSRLDDIMEECGIREFDFINISMVLLHLKNPSKVLRTVRRYLSESGVAVIKDMDDGLSLAYPDPDGMFERASRVCNELDTSGYRKSGRQIYSMLSKCGMKDISLELMGISTAGMGFKQRQALFDTCFSYVREDLHIMLENHPGDERLKEDAEWYLDNYDSLEEQFHSEEFLYTAGFMIFTAGNRNR